MIRRWRGASAGRQGGLLSTCSSQTAVAVSLATGIEVLDHQEMSSGGAVGAWGEQYAHTSISLALRISQARIACCVRPPGAVRPDRRRVPAFTPRQRGPARRLDDAGQGQDVDHHAIRDGAGIAQTGNSHRASASSLPRGWPGACVLLCPPRRRCVHPRACSRETQHDTEKQHTCSDRRPDAAGQGRGRPNRQRSPRLGLVLWACVGLSEPQRGRVRLSGSPCRPLLGDDGQRLAAVGDRPWLEAFGVASRNMERVLLQPVPEEMSLQSTPPQRRRAVMVCRVQKWRCQCRPGRIGFVVGWRPQKPHHSHPACDRLQAWAFLAATAGLHDASRPCSACRVNDDAKPSRLGPPQQDETGAAGPLPSCRPVPTGRREANRVRSMIHDPILWPSPTGTRCHARHPCFPHVQFQARCIIMVAGRASVEKAVTARQQR